MSEISCLQINTTKPFNIESLLTNVRQFDVYNE